MPPRTSGTSTTGPSWLPLLEERLHTFLDVLSAERERKLRSQEREGVLEGHVLLTVGGGLAHAHEDGGLRRELPRPVGDRLVELGGGDDPVDEADLLRLLGREPLAQQ